MATVMDMNGLSGLEQRQGFVHLYVGDGKGKTTAAAGLAARYLGCGGKALFCQFLKGRPSGELIPLERLGAVVRQADTNAKFFFQLSEEEKAESRRVHGNCLNEAAAAAESGSFGLIVLDEVVDAVNCGAVDIQELLRLLERRAPFVEVVLTGRNPDPAIVAAADYHTELVCRAHPYQKGIASRRGVEY